MHSALFKDIETFRDISQEATDPLKLNNPINTCLINLNIISYHSFSLNMV